MRSYSYSETRQNLAAVLEQARCDGAVRIQRRDGQNFILAPEPVKASPLDIPGIVPATPVTREDLLLSIHEGRRNYK